MLARYGTVVILPYNQGSSSVESMAGDIKAAVEARAASGLLSLLMCSAVSFLTAVCLHQARPCSYCVQLY